MTHALVKKVCHHLHLNLRIVKLHIWRRHRVTTKPRHEYTVQWLRARERPARQLAENMAGREVTPLLSPFVIPLGKGVLLPIGGIVCPFSERHPYILLGQSGVSDP